MKLVALEEMERNLYKRQKPRVDENRFGNGCVTYWRVGVTKKRERLEAYGLMHSNGVVFAEFHINAFNMSYDPVDD